MKLQELDYSQYEDTPQEWEIVDCTLGDINLIVGKNATGKTRTINVIRGLATLLSDAADLRWVDGNYTAKFIDNSETVSYHLHYQNRKVIAEELTINSKTCLTRGPTGEGMIYAEEIDHEMKFHTPSNQIAAFAKRDSIQHPFLDKLYAWGEGFRRYDFGTLLGRDRLEIETKGDSEEAPESIDSLLKSPTKVVEIFLRGEDLSDDFVQAVIDDMSYIGYQVENIGVEPLPGVTIRPKIPATFLGIFVKEADRQGKTYQPEISQGMFRALSVLIQINCSLLVGEPSCILIDDIGEGLDFDRSSSLVKRLINKIEHSNTQLIMATNDRFIMNNVPLQYWIILERQGGKSIHHNYRNSEELFDQFLLTGLSNFDLFSSGYYLHNKTEQ